MKPLEKCCFCCDLETGAYTLAILGFIGSILIIVSEYLVAITTDNFPVEEWLGTDEIALSVLSVVVYTMIILGTRSRRSAFLLPYLVYAIIQFVLFVFQLIIQLINVKPDKDGGYALVLTVIGLFFIVAFIDLYIWLCIFSLYKKFRSEKHGINAYHNVQA